MNNPKNRFYRKLNLPIELKQLITFFNEIAKKMKNEHTKGKKGAS